MSLICQFCLDYTGNSGLKGTSRYSRVLFVRAHENKISGAREPREIKKFWKPGQSNMSRSVMSEKFFSLKSIVISFLCVLLIIINANNLHQRYSKEDRLPAKFDKTVEWKRENPKQIYFCKTHKTGGSTLQSIIFRTV